MKSNKLITLSGLALTCQSVFAAEAVSTPATGFLQIMLALLFVIALMLALAWVMKRVAPMQGQQQLGMKIIGSLHLGQREKIMVVEVGDQWLILGVTPSGISRLESMPRQEHLLQNGTPVAGTAFQSWLQSKIAKRAESQNTGSNT
ncbi:flagellar biosynthetic protein FliO [Undibacterium luofuense]|uniref:flagellar biosynthetic protein FliO n=1 Tax=Undibacterium luofuense TaxID=2828733 RepID=UPI0030EBA999